MTPTAPLFSGSCSLSLLSSRPCPGGPSAWPSPVPSAFSWAGLASFPTFSVAGSFPGPLSSPVWSPSCCLSDFLSLVPTGCSCPSPDCWLSRTCLLLAFLTLLGAQELLSKARSASCGPANAAGTSASGTGDLASDSATVWDLALFQVWLAGLWAQVVFPGVRGHAQEHASGNAPPTPVPTAAFAPGGRPRSRQGRGTKRKERAGG